MRSQIPHSILGNVESDKEQYSEHEESDNIFRKTLWLKKMELIIERILNFPNTLSHKFSESEHIVNQLSGFCTRCMFTKARHMPFH